MDKKNGNIERKHLLQARRNHRRWVFMVIILGVLVTSGTFMALSRSAVARTYQKQVLDCRQISGTVSHVHNDDCYYNGELVCPLQEIPPHRHTSECWQEEPVLVCGLEENDGHWHSDDCFAPVMELACGMEESAGDETHPAHQHSPACYRPMMALVCGLEEIPGDETHVGHRHTDACFEEVRELACGMEEGEGAHYHTDACWGMQNTLICGQAELPEHVHGPECFITEEMTPEEVAALNSDPTPDPAVSPAEDGTINTVEGDRTNAVATFGYHLDDEQIVGYGILPQNPDYVSTDENLDDELEGLIVMTNEQTAETNAPAASMPAQSWERTAGGIKVTVEAPEGAFPENTIIAVTPVNGNSLKDTVSDAVSGEVLEVQAVDITFFDAEGHEIEPAIPIRVVMTPAATEHAEEKTSVVHVDVAQQTAELIEQAVGTEFDNSEVVFDADAFTIYAIVYTYQVEYEYEVDGKTFTSSMPGAENMTLTQIVEGLGIVDEAEIETFVSKIASIASSNEEVAVVNENNEIRVLKDGEAKIVITMQDGAKFHIDVRAEGETSASNETATVSTVGELYLPGDAELKAEVLDEVKSESAIAAVEAQEGTPDSNTAALSAYQVFDISLENVSADQYDGFQVEVKLPENVVGRDFRLFHIHNGETTEINLNTISRAADDTGLEVVSGFTFETNDFSEFVLKYTVDFTYEDRTWNFPGQGSYRLADVLAVLGIEGSIDEAALTLIMGEDHTGALYLTQAGGEYYINSDIAFTDTYELRVRIGERIYIITVTDTQESTNLSYFLKNAVVTGATQDSEGKYHVESGEEYSIILTFTEDSSYQFADTQKLTYQMPAGITILSQQEGDANINVVYNGRTYRIPFHFVLDTNGLLTINFDQNNPNFSILEDSTNVSFRFTYNGQFNGEITHIEFTDVVERDIIFDEPKPGQAFVEKKGVFDETTGTFRYTITVTADGYVTNVNVKDVLTGDALIFNNDVQVSGNSSSYTNNGATNGFDYTFASMQDGETITITYSANVDFGKDTDKDGKITVDQTKNTATVKPEDGEPHTSEFSREINFNTTSKSAGADGGTTAEGDKILDWTIEYNPLALASAAGYTVTDTIGASSQAYMKYYGSGITVEVRDHSGNLVETRTIPYNSLTAHSDSSWTYTIPAADTTPYHYTIRYQTVVDMDRVNGLGVTVHVDNEANGQHNGADVTPDGEIGVTKNVESFDTQEVNWIATLSVPEAGLAQAVVTDTVPVFWHNNTNNYDLYKDGSLEVTGLLPGESYNVSVTDSSVTITFYQDTGKTITGLQGQAGGHTITVRLTTKVNQDWLQASYEDGSPNWWKDHVNTISFNGKQAQATVTFSKPGIKKTGAHMGNGSFMYTVVLSGVSEVPVSVKDTFDTNLLEVDTSKASTWNHMKIWGGNQYDQSNGITPISYTDTPDGILLTANSVPMMNNGQYYPYYKIVYYLKLKDGVDLEQLAIANGGEHHLVNTAKWGDHEDEFDYTTTYDYLDKQLLNAGELGGTDRKAQYQITFNSAKATLHGGEPMEMTDTISANLSVDYSSIRIVTDPTGQTVPYSLKGGPNGTTIATYTVPDSTKVVITYTASVRGNGTQTIVNKVSVNGEEETVTTEKSYGTVSEGEGAVPKFKIVKVDGYDANKKLEGVRFKIFAENPNIYFDKEETVKELILTTDINGEIILDGGVYELFFDECYHVQEVEPLPDYGTISFDYLVTLTNDMDNVNYEHYIYYFDDEMQIKNWPLEGLVIEKQVESSQDTDKNKFYEFKVSILKDDGTVNTDYNEKNGDDQFVKGVATFRLKDKEQKMFWGFKKGTKYKVEEIDSNGLTVSYTYSTYDENGNVTGTTTVSESSHTGTLTQQNEIISFKNSREEQKGALKLTKLVTVNSQETNGTAADGTYTFTITDSGTPATDIATVAITVTNGVAASATVDGTIVALDSDGFVVISDLTPGDYTITETTPTNGTSISKINGQPTTTTYNTTVTVVAGDTTAAQASATATFTNNIDLGSLEITKSIQRNGTIDTSATGTFYYAVYNAVYNASANPAQTPVRTGSITVTTNGPGKTTESDLPYGTYYVYELTGENGTPIVSGENGVQKVISDTIYTVTGSRTSAAISSSATQGSVTLTNNVETTDISVEKKWKPAIPENTTITIGLYSGKTAAAATTQVTTIDLDGTADSTAVNINGTDTKAGTKQENPGWTAEFKNLPKYAYDTADGVYEIQYVVKETSAPEGYTVSYSGTGADTDYVITGGTITNTKKPGDLELTKKVAGGGDINKEFEFTIELTAPAGETLAESYTFKKGDADATGITYTRNATATETAAANTTAMVSGIKLKADETFTIVGLPAGTTYKITEADYSSEGYSSSIPADGLTGTITGGTTAKESVEVTNTLSAGDLTVEKTIEGNAADADKVFEFKVTFEKSGLAGVYGSYKIGTAESIEGATASDITFTAGKAEITFHLKGGQKAVFSNLPDGTGFTVEEISKDTDGYETTVSSATGTIDNTNKTVTGSISSTVAVTVSYVNRKNTTDAEATKVWKNGDTTITWPDDVESVEFTLYKTVNGQTTPVAAADLTNYWTDTAAFTNPISVNKDTEGKKASWADLPTRMLVTTTEIVGETEVTTTAWADVTYSVKETKINYTAASGKNAETVEIAADSSNIITNTSTTSIHVTKEWQDQNGTVLTGNEIPENAQVTFTLYAGTEKVTRPAGEGGTAVDRTVTLTGTDATEGGTVAPTSDDYEGANWTAYFTNLPVYDSDGKVITYTVQETVTWTGFVLVTTGDGITYPAADGGKIINKESALSLDILKVDKNNTVIPTGATFEIVQVNDTTMVDVVANSDHRETTGTDGKLTFSSLKVGFYRITEITPPPGYVLPSDATFYVEVTETGISLLTKGEGKPSTWDKTQTSGGVVKTFTAKTETANAQATVENTPGMALPMTGGEGTLLFSVAGTIFLLTATLGLMAKKRRKTSYSAAYTPKH